jgi:hypothetical protein
MVKGIQVQPCVGDDCHCDSVDCSIGRDDFNRPDDASVTGWTETNFSVSSNQLVTSSSNSVARFNTPHPDGDSDGVVSALVSGSADDEIQVFLDATDSSNFHYAELRLPAAVGEPACLSLHDRVGGLSTTLNKINVDAAAAVAHTLQCFLSPDGLLTARLDFGQSICAQVTPIGGDQAGVAVGSISGSAHFDNFSFLRHRQASGDYASCPSAPCGCGVIDDNFEGSAFGCQYSGVAGWARVDGLLWPLVPNLTLWVEARGRYAGTSGAYTVVTSVLGHVGDVAKILFDDGNIYAELIFGPSGRLSIYSGGGRLTFLNVSTPTDAFVEFRACLQEGTFEATVSGRRVAWNLAGIGTGKCGIGVGATAANVAFDSLAVSVAGGDCPNCKTPCKCCPDNVAATTVVLEMEGWAKTSPFVECECSPLNDTFVLKWIGECTWRHVFDPPICAYRYIELSIECPGGMAQVSELHLEGVDSLGGRVSTLIDRFTPPSVPAVTLETCFGVDWPGREYDSEAFHIGSKFCVFDGKEGPSDGGARARFAFGP